jgi:hypothetical protein
MFQPSLVIALAYFTNQEEASLTFSKNLNLPLSSKA